jgi:hypothetical protein
MKKDPQKKVLSPLLMIPFAYHVQRRIIWACAVITKAGLSDNEMFYGDRRLNLRIINNLRTSSKHTAEVWLHLNHKTSLVTRSNWKSLAMGFLSNPPRGFVESVAMLNAIPQGALAEMASILINASHHLFPFRLRTSLLIYNIKLVSSILKNTKCPYRELHYPSLSIPKTASML